MCGPATRLNRPKRGFPFVSPRHTQRSLAMAVTSASSPRSKYLDAKNKNPSRALLWRLLDLQTLEITLEARLLIRPETRQGETRRLARGYGVHRPGLCLARALTQWAQPLGQTTRVLAGCWERLPVATTRTASPSSRSNRLKCERPKAERCVQPQETGLSNNYESTRLLLFCLTRKQHPP